MIALMHGLDHDSCYLINVVACQQCNDIEATKWMQRDNHPGHAIDVDVGIQDLELLWRLCARGSMVVHG